MIIKDKDGNDVDIPDANLDAYAAPKIADSIKAKETELLTAHGAEKTKLEEELGRLNGIITERAGEFKQFRKLSEDAVAKLSVAEKTIYENGLLLQEEREKREAGEKTARENAVTTIITAKAGKNEKLAAKMKDMWPLLGIEATTPEQLEQKANMILGAISQSEPDLVASVAGFSGGHLPPDNKPKDGQTYADTQAGQALGKDLGLVLETPKA